MLVSSNYQVHKSTFGLRGTHASHRKILKLFSFFSDHPHHFLFDSFLSSSNTRRRPLLPRATAIHPSPIFNLLQPQSCSMHLLRYSSKSSKPCNAKRDSKLGRSTTAGPRSSTTTRVCGAQLFTPNSNKNGATPFWNYTTRAVGVGWKRFILSLPKFRRSIRVDTCGMVRGTSDAINGPGGNPVRCRKQSPKIYRSLRKFKGYPSVSGPGTQRESRADVIERNSLPARLGST